jgi:uncharacterized membrane protein (UPF0127 family)
MPHNVHEEGKLIVSLTSGNVVCEHVELADRPLSRMRGLLGREVLPPGEGMLLRPAPSIHTAFMRFAIDAVFIDHDMVVLRVVSRIKPWRIATARTAWGLVELAAGEAERRGVGPGDRLLVIDDDFEPAVTEGAVWRIEAKDSLSGVRGANGGGAPTPAGTSTSGDPVAVGSHAEGAPPAASRVLLLGSDRRFLGAASALLARRGFSVGTGSASTQPVELARRERADVVVLDVGTSLTAAAHEVARFQALDPSIGLVIVGDEPQVQLAAMPVLAKWGSFEALLDAVEHARGASGAGTN